LRQPHEREPFHAADYLDECEVFPAGKYKDQVDASSGAFSKLSAGTAYLTDYDKWL
jgi:phage terminase large subunit-like protein